MYKQYDEPIPKKKLSLWHRFIHWVVDSPEYEGYCPECEKNENRNNK